MTNGVPVIRVNDVSKRFVIRKEKSLKERLVNLGRSNLHREDFWAIDGVSLEVESGTTVGLIGPNGSGKSTLLKLIGGIVQPTSGTIERRGRLAALLELGAGFHPDLTGRENVFLNSAILGLSQAQTAKHFDAIVDFSGVEKFIDTQVKFYSSGMYVRLAFAVAVHVDPDVLLVDEVLAVGDEPFQRKCMDRIRAFQHEGRTIVLVTHALDQVAEICDRAVVLEGGKVMLDGEPRSALRLLRGDFEVTRQGDLERERERELAVTHQQRRAQIRSVRLLDDEGAEVREIAPGAAVTVDVEVESTDLLTDWTLGISIDSTLGQIVFGTNSKLMNIPMPTLDGRRRVAFRFGSLWLGEGQFTVQAAVADESGLEIDRLAEAAPFAVRTDGRSIGNLYAQPELLLSDHEPRVDV
jgi:ABC-2 type transport system ATP-binding protein